MNDMSDETLSKFEDQNVPVSELQQDVVAFLVVNASSIAGADDAVVAFANPGFDVLHNDPAQGRGVAKVEEVLLNDPGDRLNPVFRHVTRDNSGSESSGHFGASVLLALSRTWRFPDYLD